MEGAFLASPENSWGFYGGIFRSACRMSTRPTGRRSSTEPFQQSRRWTLFWGDRYGWVRDPFGHMWALCTVKEVLTPSQVEERLRGYAAQSTTQDKGQTR